jgi:hypothetical protein
MAGRFAWTRTAALVVGATLLTGCGGGVGAERVEQAAAGAHPTPSPAPTTGGPGSPGDSADCKGQPRTFAPMSASTFKELRREEPGFRFRAVEPSTVPGIISPRKAAGRPPSDACGPRRLVRWELALGRVTTDVPCTMPDGWTPRSSPLLPGQCRKMRDNALQYIVVRVSVGDFLGHGCPTCGSGFRENVSIFSFDYVDALTGKDMGGGTAA